MKYKLKFLKIKMTCGLWTIVVVSFIVASLTLQAALKNGLIDFSNVQYPPSNLLSSSLHSPIPSRTPQIIPEKLYTCHYAGMWCTCFANNQGGCSVGCSPNVYKSVYNQTSCPQLSSFILAGFTLA